MTKHTLLNGDCLEQLKLMPDNSIDSIVTDPPYGINFMGKKWDYEVPTKEVFQEMLRVLKPGGHMLCACGTRTQHRMAVNIEDAGFEIRDVVTWLYGSGFPKSMDISKAIDKAAGAKRTEVLGERHDAAKLKYLQKEGGYTSTSGWKVSEYDLNVYAPATDSAKQWQGWGTALKPACEFFTLARKPLSGKTVAANVLEHGTGGINIDGCRVGTESTLRTRNDNESASGFKVTNRSPVGGSECGRWPANLILDEEAAEVLDEQTGILKSGKLNQASIKADNKKYSQHEYTNPKEFEASEGGASRFFYVAKASKSERNKGCEGMIKQSSTNYGSIQEFSSNPKNENFHPTVKPIKLMTYLCRLITPPNGTVLDPYMGSGSTGVAAIKEGLNFIGIEREASYFEICKARIEASHV